MIKIKTTIEEVERGIRLIQDKGGLVVGTYTKGEVSVQGVRANFTFNEEEELLQIAITDKPWLATDSMIEREIKKFFSK